MNYIEQLKSNEPSSIPRVATGQGLIELKGTAPAEIQPTQTGPEPALSKLQQ